MTIARLAWWTATVAVALAVAPRIDPLIDHGGDAAVPLGVCIGAILFASLARKSISPAAVAAVPRGRLAARTLVLTVKAAHEEAVFRAVGLSRNESAELVESVLDQMSEALVRGETVKISSFGTFSVRAKSARVGRNPKTGEEVPIEPRRVLTFRPSHIMKERVDMGNKR